MYGDNNSACKELFVPAKRQLKLTNGLRRMVSYYMKRLAYFDDLLYILVKVVSRMLNLFLNNLKMYKRNGSNIASGVKVRCRKLQ